MSSKSKSVKYPSESSSECASRVKFAKAKKSSSSEVFQPPRKSTARRTVKATRSKNSISTSGMDASIAFADLSKDEELGNAFEKFWKAVTDGMENNPRSSLPRNSPIDNKMSRIQKRIELNQAILQSANEKLKSIDFKMERQNLSRWKENMFGDGGQDDSRLLKDMKALDLEVEKLKRRKSDRSVFLKSSPGIANFHEAMESTLNMLDKMQNADEFQELERSFQATKKELDVDYIKAPNATTVSEEE